MLYFSFFTRVPSPNFVSSLHVIISAQRNILGTLPVELSYLERLETLVLSNNDIFGEIPSALAELKLLKILDLSNNTINGALPDSLFQQTNLQKVVLSNNSIHGSIPSSLANLSSLSKLFLLSLKVVMQHTVPYYLYSLHGGSLDNNNGLMFILSSAIEQELFNLRITN
jgi:Leucine-rich repeat (LRR) protein